jgi:hypothetical protein
MHPNRITRHLSYANVMATLGVFVALGGASYAAVALPANSVGTKQLKRARSPHRRSKRNAVSSAKVKDGSLQRGDFASGTLLHGAQGPQGLQGPKGDPGQNGAPGAPGQQGAPGTARAFAFVNLGACTGLTGPCPVERAKNVVGARCISLGGYCVHVAAGIDSATSGSAAGVDFTHSNNPEGNGVAMSLSDSPSLCLASEFAVSTWRIPTSRSSPQSRTTWRSGCSSPEPAITRHRPPESRPI